MLATPAKMATIARTRFNMVVNCFKPYSLEGSIIQKRLRDDVGYYESEEIHLRLLLGNQKAC